MATAPIGSSSSQGSSYDNVWRPQNEGLRSRRPSGSPSGSRLDPVVQEKEKVETNLVGRYQTGQRLNQLIGERDIKSSNANPPVTIDHINNLANNAVFCDRVNTLYNNHGKEYGWCEFSVRMILFFLGAGLAASNSLGLLESPVTLIKIVYFVAVLLSVGGMYSYSLGKTSLDIWEDKNAKGGIVPYVKEKCKEGWPVAGVVAGTIYGIGCGVLDSDNAGNVPFVLAGVERELASTGLIVSSQFLKYSNWFLEVMYPAMSFYGVASRYGNNLKDLWHGDTRTKMLKDARALLVLQRYNEIAGGPEILSENVIFNKELVKEIVAHMSQDIKEYKETIADLESIQFDKGRMKRLLALWNGYDQEVSSEKTGRWHECYRKMCRFINARKMPLLKIGTDTASIYITGVSLGVPFAAPSASDPYYNDFKARGLLEDPKTSEFPFGLDCKVLQGVPVEHITAWYFRLQILSYNGQGGTFSPLIIDSGKVVVDSGKALFVDCDSFHLWRYMKHKLGGVLTPAGIFAACGACFGVYGYYNIALGVEGSVEKFRALLDCDIGVPYMPLMPLPSAGWGTMGRWFLNLIVMKATYATWSEGGNGVIRNFNPKAELRRFLNIRNRNQIAQTTYGPAKLEYVSNTQKTDPNVLLQREGADEMLLRSREVGTSTSLIIEEEQEPDAQTITSRQESVQQEVPRRDSMVAVDVHQEAGLFEMPQNLPAIQEAQLNLNNVMQEIERMLSSHRPEEDKSDDVVDGHRSSTSSAATTVIDMYALDEALSGLRESNV